MKGVFLSNFRVPTKQIELEDLMFRYVTVYLKNGQIIKGYVYQIFVFERLIVLETVKTKKHFIDADLIKKVDIRL